MRSHDLCVFCGSTSSTNEHPTVECAVQAHQVIYIQPGSYHVLKQPHECNDDTAAMHLPFKLRCLYGEDDAGDKEHEVEAAEERREKDKQMEIGHLRLREEDLVLGV